MVEATLWHKSIPLHWHKNVARLNADQPSPFSPSSGSLLMHARHLLLSSQTVNHIELDG